MIYAAADSSPIRNILARNLIKSLAKKNLILNQKVRILSQKSLRDRIFIYLRTLPKDKDEYVKIPFTQTALAEYLGVNRSALSRELGRMQNEGLLVIDGKSHSYDSPIIRSVKVTLLFLRTVFLLPHMEETESIPFTIKDLNEQYDEIISWSSLYDSASIEAKKMIVNSMIKRVDVYRNYELNVELNMNIRQFFLGMEESESIPITA